MKKFINYNGNIYEEGQAVLMASDHSYRYGDGLFETMKMIKGNILFEEFHFERLSSGSEVLKFSIPALFTKQKISEEIKTLCKKNNCEELARIRLSVSRGNGGLYDCDNKFSYLLECWPLERNSDDLNSNGLIVDVFPDARKTIDAFSNLKSANYLPYVMAAVWAKENKLNDALILNQHNRICDATIANVFWVKDNKVYTPTRSEGCVAGIMRNRILDLNLDVSESMLTEETLLNADEIFLTNVITGIRWVKQCRDMIYANKVTAKVYAELNRTKSL
jgi:branched-chain amino acid aminotransferase